MTNYAEFRDIGKIYALLCKFFSNNDEKIDRWLATPNLVLFGGMTPVEFAKLKGMARLREVVERAMAENEPSPNGDTIKGRG